jgi:hypothetical protein
VWWVQPDLSGALFVEPWRSKKAGTEGGKAAQIKKHRKKIDAWYVYKLLY